MRRGLDLDKAEAALKRAAEKAMQGTREERSGRFFAGKGAPRAIQAPQIEKRKIEVPQVVKEKKEKPICFFVSPIGEPESTERKRADQIQRYIINETLSSTFKIVRADELPHPGSITHQVIELLYRSALVIADLTGSNANVAYELAIRHSFNKVSIHLIDKNDVIPFDLKDERTIVFDSSDMDSVDECKSSIKKIVEAILSGKVPYRSPVFRALGVIASSTEEQGAFLDKIADQIDSIATDVSSIDTTLTFSDIDEIDSIKDAVGEITKVLDELKDEIEKISSKLD